MKISETGKQGHFNCFSYVKNKKLPSIEIKHFKGGLKMPFALLFNEIVVVYKGTLNFSFGRILDKKATQGDIIVFPAQYDCTIDAKEDTTLIIFRVDTEIRFCDHFSFEMLYNEGERPKEEKIHLLKSNDVIKNYFSQLTKVLNDGLYCNYLLEIKLKEFLFLLRYYYPMEELKAFFAVMLNGDFEFSMLIMKNYTHELSVEDLAKKLHYSVSGFGKRFRKVFNMPPAQWLEMRKARAVYHEINCSTKTFSELGYEFGFSSPSHFNNFCKRIFKDSPGEIRRKSQGKDYIF